MTMLFLKHAIVIQMFLCLLNDMNHHLKCLKWVFTLCRLSGKHYSICSVIYGVRNVCYLSSCRTWITHHRIKHLCCCDNCLELIVTFLDHHLLKIWKFLCRNLNSEVSTGNHDTICCTNDLIDIADSFFILNLCNNRNVRSSERLQICLDLKNTLCISYERCSDKINPLLCSKFNIFFIFLSDCRKSYRYSRYINALFLSEFTTVDDLTMNFFVCFSDYFQSDQTIIDQNNLSFTYIFCKSLICDRYFILITNNIFCSKCKGLPCFKLNLLSVFQNTCTDLWSLCIQKNSCRCMLFLAKLFEHIHTTLLLFMITMREVETSYIHAILDEFSHQFSIICVWSHRTYYFCFFHTKSISPLKNITIKFLYTWSEATPYHFRLQL